MDIISHTFTTIRENANTIFTGEKQDKSDELADILEDLTINNVEYYKSDTSTVSVAQGDLTHNPDTVIHTRNGNKNLQILATVIFAQKY